MRANCKRTVTMLLSVFLLAVLGTTALTVTAAGAETTNQKPSEMSAEQVAATVKPSVVYLNIKWTGYVQMSGAKHWWKTTVSYGCSGFVVNSSGYVATAGHCVDPAEAKRGLIDQFLSDWVKDGTWSARTANSLRDDAYETWKVEGHDSGSPPGRAVNVYQSVAASGIRVTAPMRATVVDFKAFSDGDVALLKVQPASPMPALQVASAEPDTGLKVLAVGYPGSVGQVVDSSREPSFKSGQVGSNQTAGGSPVTEIDAAVSPGMSGGPTVGLDGKVIGINSFKVNGETQAFNFITGNSPLQQILSRNGVSQTPSAADAAYRNGLDLYFQGKYHAAWKQLDFVTHEVPNHAQAQAYATKAFNNFPNEKHGSSFPVVPVLVVLFFLGTVVVLGGVGAIVVLGRRKKVPAAAAPLPVWGATTSTPEPTPEPTPVPMAQPAPTPEPEITLPIPEVAPTTNKFCTSCGTPARLGDRFCGTCGNDLPSLVTNNHV